MLLVAVTPSHGFNLSMRLNPSSFKGTQYTIAEFPRPSLRRVPNSPVVDFDDASLQSKTQEMLHIMYESKGVGLAAPQIGLNEAIFVYNPSNSRTMERIVINPTISKYSEQTIVEKEGCLSLRSDECAGQVSRSEWIEVQYANELGQKTRRRLKGFEARVFQHEYDHLKGILCLDRFPPEDREAAQENIDKLLGLYTEDDAIADPDGEELSYMQPPPLTARYMPPLEEVVEEKETRSKAGFGPKKSGFGGGKAVTRGGKKKKPKTRDGSRSSDPRFKRIF